MTGKSDFRALNLGAPSHGDYYPDKRRYLSWNDPLRQGRIYVEKAPDPELNEIRYGRGPHVIRNPLRINGKLFPEWGEAIVHRPNGGELTFLTDPVRLPFNEGERRLILGYITKYMWP